MEASDDGETLGARLRRLAAARGWSDEEAARRAGVSYRQYQRWLSGDSDPRGSSLRRLADTFEVQLDELIPGAPSERQLDRIERELGRQRELLEEVKSTIDQMTG